MKQKFKSGDLVINTTNGNVLYLKDFWQGTIGGYWRTNSGYYMTDTTFEHACDALKILFGATDHDENTKIK